MKVEATTPLRAIRLKCLDCCCGSVMEVRLCTATDCPLHGYRKGHKPKKSDLTATVTESAESKDI